MADIEHSAIGGNANQHALYRWAHADQAARFAEVVAAGDVGKVSKQASNSTYWILVDNAQVGNAAGWKEVTDTGALAAASTALSTANAAGVIATAAVPQTRTWTAGSGLLGGGDGSANRSFACDFGAVAGKVCEGNDTRVVNAVQTTRTITTTAPLTGGGDLSANRTLAVNAVSNTSSGVAPQHAGAADVGKSLVATSTGSQWSDASVKFYAFWGCVAAAGNNTTRYLIRSAGALLAGATAYQSGEYPAPVAGTFTFLLQWRVGGTPLATDTIALAVMINGVASALTATVAASTVSGQATVSLTVAAGDGIAIRAVQSSTEAQANLQLSVTLRAQ